MAAPTNHPQLAINAATANARQHADDTTVAPATAGAPTVAEMTTFAAGGPYTDQLLYYTGDDTTTSTPTYVYWVDSAGAVTELQTPASAANARQHADDTTVAPATAGAPTVAEITTFTTAGAHTDKLIYYTGDDTTTSTPTYVYWVDAAGVVTELLAPVASSSQQNTQFVDATYGNDGTGTVDRRDLPYATIAAAIAASASGDTVIVAPGTYAETLTLVDGVNLHAPGVTVTSLIDGGTAATTRVTGEPAVTGAVTLSSATSVSYWDLGLVGGAVTNAGSGSITYYT